MPDAQGPAPDRFTGWKDIAAFFDRSVRAVQRWERELGLPVHRIKTARGATVYALREELAEWLRAIDPERLEAASGVLRATQGRSQHPHAARAHQKWDGHRRWLHIAAASLVLLGIIAFPVFLRNQPAGVVADLRVTGQTLEALDVAGTVLWTFDLGFAGRVPTLLSSPNPLLTDLDRDGQHEVVVVVQAGTGSADVREGDRMFCFSPDGSLRWSYSMAAFPYAFDGRRFAGPTRFVAWTADGNGHVWLSINHHTWWPSLLVRLDARGGGEVRYVQSGAMYALRAWSAQGRRYIVAGGVDNEYRLASVAVLDVAAPPATSPQTPRSGFHCDGCPDGSPAAFMLFPRSDVGPLSGDPYSLVERLTTVGDRMKVTTYEGLDAYVVHFLTPTLRVEGSELADKYLDRHVELERAGRLSHSFADCPYRLTVGNVAMWRPSDGWATGRPPTGP